MNRLQWWILRLLIRKAIDNGKVSRVTDEIAVAYKKRFNEDNYHDQGSYLICLLQDSVFEAFKK